MCIEERGLGRKGFKELPKPEFEAKVVGSWTGVLVC